MVKFVEIQNRKKRWMILVKSVSWHVIHVIQKNHLTECFMKAAHLSLDGQLIEHCGYRGVERIPYGITHNCVCVRMRPYVEVKETLVMKNHTFQIFHKRSRSHKQGQGAFMRFKVPPIERQKWNTFTLKWDSAAEIQTQKHPKTLKHVRMTIHTTVYVCITPVCPSLSGHIWLQFDLSQGMYQLQCPRVSCWDFSGLTDSLFIRPLSCSSHHNR